MQRTLKYSLMLAIGAVVAAASSPALAGTVFSDTFTKTDQVLLGTTPDVGGAWTITGTSVVNPLAISGGVVPINNTGQDAYSAFTAPVAATAGTTLHTSMDINLSAVNAGGDYFSHLSDPAGTTSFFFQRLGARPGPTSGYQLGLAETGGGGATTDYGTTVLALGTKYHIDINWNFVAGASNDTFAISVDGVPYLNKTWLSTNAEPTLVSAANLRQGTASTAPTLTIDNYKVEAVPEPATLGLLAIAGVMAAFRRRSL